MATTQTKERFSAQAAPELLAAMRQIAHVRGHEFEAVLEDAMQEYIERQEQPGVQSEAMAHFRASLERNRRLYELLAQ